MSELIQTGQHPDADQLSAFAEHVLPVHEREQVLAHMAVCAECREVVMLALPPMDDEEPARVVAAPRPWFSGWKLVWPAIAAVAATLVVVLDLHRARPKGIEPGQQVAEMHAPAPPPSAVPPVEAPAHDAVNAAKDKAVAPPAVVGGVAMKAPAPVPSQAPNPKDVPDLPMQGRNLPPLPLGAPPQAFLQQRSGPSPQQQSTTQGNVSAAVTLGAAMPAAVAQPKPAPSKVNLGSGMPAVGPATTTGGPVVVARGAAAPVRLGNAAPPPPAPQTVAKLALPPPAAPPPPPASAPAPRQGQTTIAAAALDALAAEPEANASATVINGAALASLSNASRPVLRGPLPSKLAALSVVAQGQREVAIDTAHALFVSEDGGLHWKGVKPRWKGQAVRLELANGAMPAAAPALLGGSMGGLGRAIAGNAVSNADTATATASPAGTAMLTGTVIDPAGAVVPGATVKVTNSANGAAVSVRADQSGRYGVTGLAAGTYRVDATAPGFAALQTTIALPPSQPVVSNLRLTIGSASETVAVASASAALELEQSTLDTQLQGKMNSKARNAALPVFAVATEKGERWVSADGQTWTKQ